MEIASITRIPWRKPKKSASRLLRFPTSGSMFGSPRIESRGASASPSLELFTLNRCESLFKAVNDELQRQGHDVRLTRADGYFYFWSGEANDWIDRTVKVPTLSSLTLEHWIEEFNRLKKLAHDILRGRPKVTEAESRSKRFGKASKSDRTIRAETRG